MHRHLSIVAAGITLAVTLAPALARAEDGHTPTGQPCWTTSGTSSNGLYHAAELDCLPNATSKPAAGVSVTPALPRQPAQPVQPTPPVPPVQPVQSVQPDPSGFFHLYQLAIPGTVISYDNLDSSTRSTIVSAGLSDTGQVIINPDGTYVWSSAWDGTIFIGTWVQTNRSDYPLVLQDGESGQSWYAGADTTGYSQAPGGIILWNGRDLAGQYRGAVIG